MRGFKDGPGSGAMFIGPVHLAFDSTGNLLVSENGNRIRSVSPDGAVTTLVGTGEDGAADGLTGQASFSSPSGFAFASGALIIADSGNQLIRVLESGRVSLLAGAGGQGFQVGAARSAVFSHPVGVAVSADGTIYVSDYNLGRIFKLVGR